MAKIISAAIKFKPKGSEYFKIMCGTRHCNVLEMMLKLGSEYEKATSVQGFLTDDDQFIDRYDAALMAYWNGQLPKDSELYQKIFNDTKLNAYQLFSEDLW